MFFTYKINSFQIEIGKQNNKKMYMIENEKDYSLINIVVTFTMYLFCIQKIYEVRQTLNIYKL